jgi:hypothetical protein
MDKIETAAKVVKWTVFGAVTAYGLYYAYMTNRQKRNQG